MKKKKKQNNVVNRLFTTREEKESNAKSLSLHTAISSYLIEFDETIRATTKMKKKQKKNQPLDTLNNDYYY